ncbi:NAD(P)-dependent oxidoreductase [Micromonospora globbae]|uniref:NAD(P)-dependent oxidoreductase n=1 Tax=Micromonospora globbae TaxID=1894969 RepID=UPI0034231519
MSAQVTIIGASGRVGSLVTREVLRRGLTARVLVRDRSRLSPDLAANPRLQTTVGQIDDPSAMRTALAGADAAIVTVGVRYRRNHPWGGVDGRHDVVPAAIRTLLTVADSDTYVVLLSAFGVRESWRHLPLIAKMIIRTSSLSVGYAGLAEAEDLLDGSNQPHALVRAVTLTDGPATGGPVDASGRQLRGNPRVSRADLAVFLVDTALSGAGGRASTERSRRVLVAAGR